MPLNYAHILRFHHLLGYCIPGSFFMEKPLFSIFIKTEVAIPELIIGTGKTFLLFTPQLVGKTTTIAVLLLLIDRSIDRPAEQEPHYYNIIIPLSLSLSSL
jgi:hypothetical protein